MTVNPGRGDGAAPPPAAGGGPRAPSVSSPRGAPPRASSGSLTAVSPTMKGFEVHGDHHLTLWDDHHTTSPAGRTNSSLGAPHEGHSGWLAGVGHIICANIGAGVLSLPNAVAWLGYVAGPIMIVVCTGVAMLCAELLTHAYRAKGERRATYKDAVQAQLGPRRSAAIVSILYLKYFLVTVGYTVVAATGMTYIARWACQQHGIPKGQCKDNLWMMTLIFSGVQMLLSQLPNLESVAGASAVGALMSLLYTAIALILALANCTNARGSALGRPAPPMQKAFGVFNALGSILFSNASAVLTIDIQHTMREPPPNTTTMRKVIRTAFGIAMGLYLATGTAGYIAVGDGVGSDILVEFEDSPTLPRAIPLIANIFTVIHFIPAYQVFAQPLFVILEQGLLSCAPRLQTLPEWPVRLVYRTLYVCVTCVLAITLPFFGAISGLIGAVAFWPTVVAGPVLMYLSIRNPRGKRRAFLISMMVAMGLVALCALIGSVYGFVRSSSTFKPFGGGGAPHRR